MSFENIIKDLSNEYYDINKDVFYLKIFSLISDKQKETLLNENNLIKSVCLENYDDLSNRVNISKLQDSCSIRNILKTRSLVDLIIDEQGELNFDVIKEIYFWLSEKPYSLGSDRQHDTIRSQHIIFMLNLLLENKQAQILLKTISAPYSNQIADNLIKETLQLPEKITINDTHAKKAVLSALLSYLRQNVGSCFATAPCIVVHDEQPLQFLKDINELFGTGRLKRITLGVEYSVPISPTWGSGDLKRPICIVNNQFYQSPGIFDAALKIGLINMDQSLKENKLFLRDKINFILNEKINQKAFINAEELIKHLTLNFLDIDEIELKNYQERPKEILSNQLININTINTSNKTQKLESFTPLFESAKNAFKALSDNALLKAWEFTVAGFAENKAGFTNWNLYSSLGVNHQEKGGIGEALYEIINAKLRESNAKLETLQAEYEVIYAQIKQMESTINHASEKNVSWVKAEYQSKRNEFYTFEELKNKTQQKTSRLANLYNELIEEYLLLFPVYFQEVYDADMHDVTTGPYDDSPAGFRLLYKYGRLNTSLWQRIYTPNQFVNALVSFFTMTENEIASKDEFKEFSHDLGEIVTAIISQIKTDEFLETAFHRMAKAHQTRYIKNPLEHLDSIDKKPWAYTSGGSMDTLVTTYFKREQKPTESTRWAESPTELNVYLIDLVKHSPHDIYKLFTQDSQKMMLMQSPTHAFTFKPGLPFFKRLWKEDAFTYTWLRDNYIIPYERFVDGIILNNDMLNFLVDLISENIPENYKSFFRKNFSTLHGPMGTYEFRKEIINNFKKDFGSSISADLIDGILFNNLPLMPVENLKQSVLEIFTDIEFNINKDVFDQFIETLKKSSYGTKFIASNAIKNVCMGYISLTLNDTYSSINFHEKVTDSMQRLKFSMPKPIIFADTNWVRDFFAFTLNPGTGNWSFWRVDCLGSTGFPLSDWDQWLNGSKKDAKWGVYTKPFEYIL